MPCDDSQVDRKNLRKAPRMTNDYPTCDHPRTLATYEVCFLCDVLGGKVDAFDHIDEVGK